ncbi:MAG: hypothetical protein QOD41_24 [Cryptosporangiaceae bacterium]|nr:hypothetical protein [Cryptosporangiaceae bacterium]
MTRPPEIDQFAAYLRMLKDRSGRGFDRLGRQTGVSRSSLHRYCSGSSVPADYGVLHVFAQVCGATRDEMRTLHRLWALADASRGQAPALQAATERGLVAVRVSTGGAVAVAERPAAGAVRSVAIRPPVNALITVPSRWRRPGMAALVASACTALVAAGVWIGAASGHTASADSRLLFSAACASTVALGQHDGCVREVQRLLHTAGATIAVDGDYGPETLRRVTAFQLKARLSPKGVVDEPTKHALYAQQVSLHTWTPAQVEQQIRAEFTEDPDSAVAVGRCQSLLDPLWILPNTNGTRNWGVFQISDARLADLGGSPRQALDPVWNIAAAHRLWAAHHDFRDWPFCSAALPKKGAKVSSQ